MKFVKLTELDGKPREWIMPSWVIVVRDAVPHETLPTAKTEIVLSGVTVFVEETPEEVVKLVEAAL